MAERGGFGSVTHLARRFFGSLSSAPPAPEDEEWVAAQLLPGEQQLWRRMSGADRRHAVGVARDTMALLSDGGPPPGREVVAAALLHDVGKVDSGLGTFSRAAVTAAAITVGRERLSSPPPAHRGHPRWRARVSSYLRHDRIGADMLAAAGSAPLTVSWAREHHLPAERWSVDRRLADALKAADDD